MAQTIRIVNGKHAIGQLEYEKDSKQRCNGRCPGIAYGFCTCEVRYLPIVRPANATNVQAQIELLAESNELYISITDANHPEFGLRFRCRDISGECLRDYVHAAQCWESRRTEDLSDLHGH